MVLDVISRRSIALTPPPPLFAPSTELPDTRLSTIDTRAPRTPPPKAPSPVVLFPATVERRIEIWLSPPFNPPPCAPAPDVLLLTTVLSRTRRLPPSKCAPPPEAANP